MKRLYGQVFFEGSRNVMAPGLLSRGSRVVMLFMVMSAASSLLQAQSALPASVTVGAGGSTRLFTATYTDSLGGTDMAEAVLHIENNNVIPGTPGWSSNECGVRYDISTNNIWLVPDAGGTWNGPIPAASNQVLYNSQCTVLALGTSAQISGNTITVNFLIMLSDAFDGTKQLYMASEDIRGAWNTNSQQQFGSFNVPAQTQLAPNPGCPNNMPYCLFSISPTSDGNPVTVLGQQNNVLYGYTICADSNVVGTPRTFCLYQSATFNPEVWESLQASISVLFPWIPVGIMFPCSDVTCLNYKYIWTTDGHIFRAATDPNNPSDPNNWNFNVDVGANLPNRPPDTAALGDASNFIFAAQGPNIRLFFGKYSYDNTGQEQPDAQVWYSDDGGDNWMNSIPIGAADAAPYTFGCREIHAVGWDPYTGSIYANVDCEVGNPANIGLWQSTDGGATFYQVQQQGTGVGVAMVFPGGTNRIFMEADGPEDHGPDAPLLFWDTVNGDPIQPTADFPGFPGPTDSNSFWKGGFGSSILLTSEQNIFLLSGAGNPIPAPPGAPSQGVWYFAPPNYDQPVLLEDLGPNANCCAHPAVEVTGPPPQNTSYIYFSVYGIVKPLFQ